MHRISRLTDYGIVLLAHLAGERGGTTHNARELAQRSNLPLPAVSKILKTLTHEGLLVSHRGAKGGYGLARDASEISVAEIIAALEGPIALTECTLGPGHCHQEITCMTHLPWHFSLRWISPWAPPSATPTKQRSASSFCAGTRHRI